MKQKEEEEEEEDDDDDEDEGEAKKIWLNWFKNKLQCIATR